VEELGCGIALVVVVCLGIAVGVSSCGKEKAVAPAAVAVKDARVVEPPPPPPAEEVVVVQPKVAKPAEPATPAEPVVPPSAYDFTVGTVPFWVSLTIVLMILIACVEFEQGFLGAFCLALFLGLVQNLGTSDPLGYVRRHPWQIVEFFAAYYAIGVMWGFVKWYLYVLDEREEYDAEKARWLASRNVRDTGRIPESLKPEWRLQVGRLNAGRFRNLGERPLARTNKTRIVRWISFWPVSLIWTIIDDFVKRVAHAIYKMIAGWYQHVANLAWRGVDDDLADAPPKGRDPEV
jgi:hypothetical protein